MKKSTPMPTLVPLFKKNRSHNYLFTYDPKNQYHVKFFQETVDFVRTQYGKPVRLLKRPRLGNNNPARNKPRYKRHYSIVLLEDAKHIDVYLNFVDIPKGTFGYRITTRKMMRMWLNTQLMRTDKCLV